jgi:hypothetical protein
MSTDTLRRVAAEFFGTFWLTFGGCGAAVLAAAFPNLGIGFVGVRPIAVPRATSVGCNLERRGCKFSAYQCRSAFRSDAGNLRAARRPASVCLLVLFVRGAGDRFNDRAAQSSPFGTVAEVR